MMNTDPKRAVEEQQLNHDFDELSGRVTPPDRLDEILRRVARGERPATRINPPLVAAAVVLLGLAATIGVAFLRGENDHEADRQGQTAIEQQWIASQADEVQQRQRPSQAEAPAPPPDQLTGTDPADLAAMRSAEAMLEAERKLQALLAAGQLDGFDQLLRFEQLSGWQYELGLQGMPESVRQLSGRKVLMTGFMLPIDEVENITQFLLVESLWSCCYGQPPDIHGLVRGVMPAGQTTDYSFEPLKVVGTFQVEATMMDGYCVDIFQLHVDSLEPIKP